MPVAGSPSPPQALATLGSEGSLLKVYPWTVQSRDPYGTDVDGAASFHLSSRGESWLRSSVLFTRGSMEGREDRGVSANTGDGTVRAMRRSGT